MLPSICKLFTLSLPMSENLWGVGCLIDAKAVLHGVAKKLMRLVRSLPLSPVKLLIKPSSSFGHTFGHMCFLWHHKRSHAYTAASRDPR